MHRRRFEIHDPGTVACGGTLQIDQDIDVARLDFGRGFLIAHLVDADDVAPEAAVDPVARKVLFGRMAEQGDLETVAVVPFQHVSEQLHRRMGIPEVVGKIADANPVGGPVMRPGAATLGSSGGIGMGPHGGHHVEPLVAAAHEAVERAAVCDDARVAGGDRRIEDRLMLAQAVELAEFLAMDEMENPHPVIGGEQLHRSRERFEVGFVGG